ncbi:hypothetical protein SAMN05660420_02850 [Desulfuromusa kysingii]|uniref:Uncharacterized protein n=1 Tax=Desulfuromusa kysingii TaxID=37625 RepID=A0A1H4D6V9_9BACT|nr:hypothetical protein [Desulfuromusa kysingii]SEA68032.1 hypothetical protein SAMN05660420_02850 [Desulfuromusa kysingii]
MLIPVVYPNGKHDLVKDFLLSRLIDDMSIIKFKRNSGWVSTTANDIRRSNKVAYDGPKRRLQDSESAEMIDFF